MLLSSLFSVIGRAHSCSNGGCRLRQNFSVAVTVESSFRHWSGSTGSFRLLQYFSVHGYCPIFFPSLVVPTQVQLALFVLSSILVLMLLSRLFFVIGRAYSVSTGSFRLLQYFYVGVTVESIYLHSGSTGGCSFLQYFSFDVTVEFFSVIDLAHSV